MTFSVDDYEKAIARIFDQAGHVIGTGFLVAPGYVLTCAHVVLQAIGIPKEGFAQYEGQPQEQISLDFHVLASGQPINVEVVAWIPYQLDNGDIAVLRLLTPGPDGAKPIPLVEVARVDVENDQHSVYGFGRSNAGGRSDAYRPKANVAGGRFQLCKVGDSNDETIKPGFSGAPVWNDIRQCVIGMVATAVVAKDEQQSTAYAIPTKVLRPILKTVDALYLHDVLEQSLEACDSEDKSYPFKGAVNEALRRCNPNGGDRSWRDQLIDLSVDRAPALGWENEGRLVQLVMMLAWMHETPASAYDRLKAWVEQHSFNFGELLDRMTYQMKQSKGSSSHACQYLMVDVSRVETALDKLRVSVWAIPDRETYNPNNPLSPIVPETVLSSQELPEFLRTQIRQKLPKKPTPTIHLFVPRALFSCDVEMVPCSRVGSVLGSEYPFVIRTNLKTHPIGYYYYDDWNQKWEQVEKAFENPTGEFVKFIDCSTSERDLITELCGIYAAILEQCESVGELFDLVSEETVLPVALWSRNPQVQDQLAAVLDGLVQQLPDRIRQERDKAYRATVKPLLGHHLSLVWEDPRIVPPDMQFDPEAC